MIVGRVDSDPMQEGREPRLAAIAGQRAVERDEDLLDQVVALGDRADEARDACPDGVCVTAEEARERATVARAGRGDQRGVVRFRLAVGDHGQPRGQASTDPHCPKPASRTRATYGANCGDEYRGSGPPPTSTVRRAK